MAVICRMCNGCVQVLTGADALLGLAAAMEIPLRLHTICSGTDLVQHDVMPAGCLLATEVSIFALAD